MLFLFKPLLLTSLCCQVAHPLAVKTPEAPSSNLITGSNVPKVSSLGVAGEQTPPQGEPQAYKTYHTADEQRELDDSLREENREEAKHSEPPLNQHGNALPSKEPESPQPSGATARYHSFIEQIHQLSTQPPESVLTKATRMLRSVKAWAASMSSPTSAAADLVRNAFEWGKAKALSVGSVPSDGLIRIVLNRLGEPGTSDRLVLVDLSNRQSWPELKSMDVVAFDELMHRYVETLGRGEVERRMDVIDRQIQQFEIVSGWADEEKKIAQQLELPLEKVQGVGQLLGGNKPFPSFEGHKPKETLDRLAGTTPKLLHAWSHYMGQDEYTRRIGVLAALQFYYDEYKSIPSELFSAWQMQGLDVERMLSTLAHCRPVGQWVGDDPVEQKLVEAEETAERKGDLILRGGSNEFKKDLIKLFTQGTSYHKWWRETLEHEELLRNAPQPKVYGTLRQRVLAYHPQLLQEFELVQKPKETMVERALKVKGWLPKICRKLVKFWGTLKSKLASMTKKHTPTTTTTTTDLKATPPSVEGGLLKASNHIPKPP